MNLSDLYIRSAGRDDVSALTGLLEQLFSIEKDFDYHPENHKKGLFLMLDGCGKHKNVWVAVKKDKIVGMCTAQTRISTAFGGICAVLEDMVIDRDYKNMGIGTLLLRKIEEWALKRGIAHLQLLADSENTPALSFYKSRNWKNTQLICLSRTL